MKVIDIINQAIKKGETRFAFELLPPLKGDTIDSLFASIDRLAPFDPAYINVTYHREEVRYIEKENGLLEKKIVSKRPGTVAISAAIAARYGIEVVPHLICGGFSALDTEEALIDLNFLGIHNVLALRGDSVKGERSFSAHPQGHAHAADLIGQIRQMNRGIFITGEVEHCAPTEFCVGAACYPEKHAESPNLSLDMEYLKKKVDAGADYIVTQMFFDNEKYYRFVDKCRKAGINVPVIPGLKPISTKAQLTVLPQTFHVDLPVALVNAVLKCKDNSEVRETGVAWAVEQSIDLKTNGVPVLHYYTMGKADNIEKIARAIF